METLLFVLIFAYTVLVLALALAYKAGLDKDHPTALNFNQIYLGVISILGADDIGRAV